MSKQEVVAALEADLKKQKNKFVLIGIVMTVLCWSLAAVIYVKAPPEWTVYIFVVFLLLAPIAGIFSIIKSKNKLQQSFVCISILSVNPEQIVWIYEKKTSINSTLSYSIVICDNAKHCYETRAIKYEHEQKDLLKSIIAVCPAALIGFRADWQPLYYKDPINFRGSVYEYEQQFKR